MNDIYVNSTDAAALSEKLAALLSRRLALYFSGSSSVRRETAESVFYSICLCLGLPDSAGALSGISLPELEARLDSGIRRFQEKAHIAGTLSEYAACHMPPVQNASMSSTVKSLKDFPRRYNPRLAAVDIPCSIDYQLAVPVPEALSGADYVISYLKRLCIENSFLSMYPAVDTHALLSRHVPGYPGLVVNLFEPVFANAAVSALLKGPGATIALSVRDAAVLWSRFDKKPADYAARALCSAAKSLPVVFPGCGEYYSICAENLAKRARSVRPAGLTGIITIFQSRSAL